VQNLEWSHLDLKVGTSISEDKTAFIFVPKEGDSMFLRNVGVYLQVHMTSLPRKPTPSFPPPEVPQISYGHKVLTVREAFAANDLNIA
jgi:hypothetical protein